MIGIITRIDQPKESRNPMQVFYRVYFKLIDEHRKTIWAKTDLVISFRNFSRWKPLLKVGNLLDGLKLRSAETVDADSYPIFIEGGMDMVDVETGQKAPEQVKLL